MFRYLPYCEVVFLSVFSHFLDACRTLQYAAHMNDTHHLHIYLMAYPWSLFQGRHCCHYGTCPHTLVVFSVACFYFYNGIQAYTYCQCLLLLVLWVENCCQLPLLTLIVISFYSVMCVNNGGANKNSNTTWGSWLYCICLDSFVPLFIFHLELWHSHCSCRAEKIAKEPRVAIFHCDVSGSWYTMFGLSWFVECNINF